MTARAAPAEAKPSAGKSNSRLKLNAACSSPASVETNVAACLNPYVLLSLTAIFIAAAEIFLKKGAVLTGGDTGFLGFAALASGATWAGIAFHILGFMSWLFVLRLMPLVEAFALINVVHVLVPVSSVLFLNETISLNQATGIIFVVAGTWLVAASAARAEAKL